MRCFDVTDFVLGGALSERWPISAIGFGLVKLLSIYVHSSQTLSCTRECSIFLHRNGLLRVVNRRPLKFTVNHGASEWNTR